MNPNASDYQRVRLWSGIFSIGTNLGLVWAFYAVSLLVSPDVLARFDVKWVLLLPVAAMLALGLVFDILSGFAAETALNRTRQPFKLWLRDWLLAAVRVATALYFGLLILSWVRFQSWPIVALLTLCAAAFWTVLTLVLPSFLPRAWRTHNAQLRAFETALRHELKNIGVPPTLAITWIESEDETTVNGAMPPLGRARIWLGSNVAAQLTPRQAALLVRRDFWFRQNGKHARETAICIGWLLLGIVGTRFVPAADALQAGSGGAAFITSWCFAALFVWPRLNSVWMRAADRDLLNVASVEEIEILLRRVQELNASDTQLPDAKASVFHPIPDLARRLENLK